MEINNRFRLLLEWERMRYINAIVFLGALIGITGCVTQQPVQDAPGKLIEVAPAAHIREGYSPEHPLPMVSIPASLDYLDRLRTAAGEPIHYERIDSVKIYTNGGQASGGLLAWLGLERHLGPILDKYEVRTPSQTVTLWLNPYAQRMPENPPEGFILAP